VAQQTPLKGVLEVSYVGNKSDYLSNWNNNFSQINDVGIGTLFNAYGWSPTSGYTTAQQNAVRPLHNYASMKIINHQMYSNYNSLQVAWNRQVGRLTLMTNYTYSKALGIRGEGGSATGDPTNLRNNYGTLPNNRTNIFNLAYVFEVPNTTGANRIVRGAVNGWQVSGITQYQTGADIQASVGAANFNYSSFIPAGTTFHGTTITSPVQATNQNVLGTPDITLMPKVICDPRKGLQTTATGKQFVNGACFASSPTVGQQGTYIFPTMTGPGFLNNDLSVFKNFTWGASEGKKLQFRFSGYNFLNHPVRTFVANDPGLNLTFDNTGKLIQNGGTTFGFANNKVGHRIMQVSAKFSF
jgi:hypothetical protein